MSVCLSVCLSGEGAGFQLFSAENLFLLLHVFELAIEGTMFYLSCSISSIFSFFFSTYISSLYYDQMYDQMDKVSQKHFKPKTSPWSQEILKLIVQ